jgi:hypothetical protein
MGYYYKQLKRYYDLFPSDQIKVVFQEDLKSRPAETLAEIFKFLEVDRDFLPDVGVRYNQGGKPKNRLLNNLLTRPSRFKRWLRPIVPKTLLHAYISLKHKNLNKPELLDSSYNHLLAAYRDDICSLEKLVSRDLSHWLAPRG